MSRIITIFIAIVTAIAFTAIAPRIVPGLAENQLMLRVARFTAILVTITLTKALFKGTGQVATVDAEQGNAAYRA